jgi:hypothetical protein
MDGRLSRLDHSTDREPLAIRLDADTYLACLCGRDVIELADLGRIDFVTLRPHDCRWRPATRSRYR